MTCVWNGLLKAIPIGSFKIIDNGIIRKPNAYDLVTLLKQNNKRQEDVSWNGTKLTEKEIEENFEAVKCFNRNSIQGGYLCSTCDSFLCLVCQLFKINIRHNYNGHIMNYQYKDGNVRTIRVQSNRGHFWAN